jgi:hypothetical protein
MSTTTGTQHCYHVTTVRGDVYGVAASGKTEARYMVAARLEREGIADSPAGAQPVGRWNAPFGTVFAY